MPAGQGILKSSIQYPPLTEKIIPRSLEYSSAVEGFQGQSHDAEESSQFHGHGAGRGAGGRAPSARSLLPAAVPGQMPGVDMAQLVCITYRVFYRVFVAIVPDINEKQWRPLRR
ncbi:hypothetical protein [Azohydromonas caseinilytica]|uniref:Uncharacterized protein n=1 Tax=Azohydromonas caseinilytica TaxID=2728836 RepID=A0A848F8Q9_9BURK|nr:hypothetical protein [Azohydromonas caseinilytica]NML16527.1 hypothetical protein [Azohydromonas caseinilytica]